MHTITIALNPKELSHEMHISLTGILGIAEIMDHDSSLNREQHEQLYMIQQSGYRLLKVVNQILEAVVKSEKEKLK